MFYQKTEMKKIIHNTKKYDGSIHYRFETEEILRTDSVLVICKEPDAQISGYRGEFKSGRSSLVFMFSDRFYNVILMWERDWSPRMIYVNIATPAVWDHREVSAVDLDIDVFRMCGNSEITIDDEDEFEIHRKKFGYPQELVDRCLAEKKQVYGILEKMTGIFSDEVFSRRPGKPLPFDPESF